MPKKRDENIMATLGFVVSHLIFFSTLVTLKYLDMAV